MKRVKNTRKELRSENQIIPLILMSLVFLFLFIAPYYKAIFNGLSYTFQVPIYVSSVAASLMLLMIGILKYKEAADATQPNPLAILIWLIPVCYIFTLFQAVSYYSAIIELFIRFSWVAFFLAGIYLARNEKGAGQLMIGIMSSGYVVVIYGFLNWFGNASYKDAILDGNRLSNVFQYPNSYGAFLVGLLFASIIIVNTTKNRFAKWASLAMLLPIAESLLLTVSRGAMLMIPVVLCVYFIFMPWKKQIQNMINLVLVFSTALLLFGPMNNVCAELAQGFSVGVSLKGWMFLIAGSALLTLMMHGFHIWWTNKIAKGTQDKNVLKKSNLIAIGLIVALFLSGLFIFMNSKSAVQLLPSQIRDRIVSNSNSILVRDAFNQDGLKVISDYPLLGTGGGGWSAIYGKYQDFPYLSNQIHNFFLQYTVESGILGVSLLLLIVIGSLYRYMAYARRSHAEGNWQEISLIYPIIAISILGHSIIDFDMTYLYLSALVFLCLGASLSFDTAKWRIFDKLPRMKVNAIWRKSGSIALIMTSVVLLIFGFRFLQADASFKEAIRVANQTGNYDQMSGALDRAIAIKPTNPTYVMYKIDLLFNFYQQTQDMKFLDEGLKLTGKIEKGEQLNFNFVISKLNFLMERGHLTGIERSIQEMLEDHPWNIQAYEAAVNYFYQLGLMAESEGNLTIRDQHWGNAFKVYDTLTQKIDSLSTREVGIRYISRDFKVTPALALNIGQIHYAQMDFEGSASVLFSTTKGDLQQPTNQAATRLYLASLKKMGKWNEELYNQLISVNPVEAVEIEKLLLAGS